MPQKKTVSAKEVANFIKSGMTDEQLMTKFNISAQGVQSLKSKLLAAGLLSETEVAAQAPPMEVRNNSDNDKRELAKKIAAAVKSGLSDDEIMSKFRIPAEKLPQVYSSLIKGGYLKQDDLVRETEKSNPEQIADTPPPTVDLPVDQNVSSSSETDKKDLGAVITALQEKNISWPEKVTLLHQYCLNAPIYILWLLSFIGLGIPYVWYRAYRAIRNILRSTKPKIKCAITGHEWSTWKYLRSGECNQERACSRCNKVAQRVEHDLEFGDFTRPDSCHKIGSCKRCDHKEDVMDHSWSQWVYTPAECKEKRVCSRCREEEGKEVHQWGPPAYQHSNSCAIYTTCQICSASQLVSYDHEWQFSGPNQKFCKRCGAKS